MVKRFPSCGIFSSPAERGFDALLALGAIEPPMPSPSAFIERGRRSLLATVRISPSTTFRDELTVVSRAESEPLLKRLLELLVSLHSAAWHHRDLYPHHILIDTEGERELIDLAMVSLVSGSL